MGKSGAGKDFLADYLIEQHNFVRFSFSDQLKKLAKIIYPWLQCDYPAIVKEEKLNIKLSTGEVIDKSPREIWLHLNTLRDIEKHLFIRMLDEDIAKTISVGGVKDILISDIRSTDELSWCQQNNFKIVYLQSTKQVYQHYDIDAQIIDNKDKADVVFVNKHNGINDFKDFYKRYL